MPFTGLELRMSNVDVVPELREILGALIFGADRPLSVKELRRCLQEVAEAHGHETAAFASVKESDVAAALGELGVELAQRRCGFVLKEVAGGFRFQSEASCGKWLRHLLSAKTNRLSRPGLETLAIIAYRQPLARPDIEAIRGVNVDHIIRLLLEMQLIRIVGRSELPGRPFLYGTTSAFLEHFGLKDLNDLKDIEPALLAAREKPGPRKGTEPALAEVFPAPVGEGVVAEKEESKMNDDDFDIDADEDEDREDEEYEDEDEDEDADEAEDDAER